MAYHNNWSLTMPEDLNIISSNSNILAANKPFDDE